MTIMIKIDERGHHWESEGLAADHLAGHDQVVGLEEGDARQAFTVLEGVKDHGLL